MEPELIGDNLYRSSGGRVTVPGIPAIAPAPSCGGGR